MPGSSSLSPLPVGGSDAVMAGGRRTRKSKGPSVKAIKRTLKKAGLKVSGKRSTLVKRAKKARLMGGADEMMTGAGMYGMMGGKEEEVLAAPEAAAMEGARRRRRSRKY